MTGQDQSDSGKRKEHQGETERKIPIEDQKNDVNALRGQTSSLH